MISPGSSPKEDGNNSVAKSAMDLQGEEAERRNIHGMVGHVINQLQAMVERDETARSKTQIEDLCQQELTVLNDHAKCKKNSTTQAQWAGKQSVKAI